VLARVLETVVLRTQAFHEGAVVTVANTSPYHCSSVLFQMMDCIVTPVEDCMESKGNICKEYCQHGMLRRLNTIMSMSEKWKNTKQQQISRI
jgi:hypothetical protein